MVEVGNLKKPTEVWGALGTRSSAIVDLDNDGDLDIFTNEFNDGPMILVSNLAEKRPIRWIKIKLTGNRSNKDGLGAKIVVNAGPSQFTKVHDGQSGYLSQSRYPLYFGLDQAMQVDDITIHWPPGVKQTVAGPINSNQLLEIEESEGNQ